MESESDRRSQARYGTEFPVQIRSELLGTADGIAHDVSRRGLMFSQPEPVAEDSLLELTITIPGETEPLVVQGKSVRCEPVAGEEYTIAVKFINTNEQIEKRLEALLSYMQ